MAVFPIPKGFQRLGAFPLEDKMMFESYAALEEYAQAYPTAYAGQICSANDNGIIRVYKINIDKTVSELGAGTSSTDSNYITLIAQENLTIHRAVLNTGWMASNVSLASAVGVAGLSIFATSATDIASIKIAGYMQESSWDWAMDTPLYLGIAGQLTQIAPASGVIVQLGVPLSQTEILINIQQPIVL